METRGDIPFSIIVPVYNRPSEVADLLESLAAQTDGGFELVIVEDGSTVTCREQCDRYASRLRLKYYHKDNEGRSPARNYGMDRADGDFYVFVDSDCILPPDYIERLRSHVQGSDIQFFGGPDAAHESFTDLQKAINFSMTAFLTTGGIRGGKRQLEKFVPRTFNMGFSRDVYRKVGGFREMFSEDIDMSTRIRHAGYQAVLLRDVRVYHKRRVDIRKFWRQVHVFGMSRITLQLLYPGSLKAVHTAPALLTLMLAAILVASIFWPWILLLPAAYLLAIWVSALTTTRRPKIATMAILTSAVQILGYGTGFIRAYVWKILLRHGRDRQQEIDMRRGK